MAAVKWESKGQLEDRIKEMDELADLALRENPQHMVAIALLGATCIIRDLVDRLKQNHIPIEG